MDLTALFDIINSGWIFMLFLPLIGYTCWKNPYEYNTFAECVVAIGGNEGTIMISNEQAIADNLTIPANITLRFIQGGSLNIAAGKIVTINGHIEAGLYQIFEGTGLVSLGFGVAREIYPQWWGAVGDGAADDTTAIQNALNAINTAGGGTLVFSQGNYLISTMLTVYANTLFRGCGKDSKITSSITGTAAINGFEDNIIFRDFWLYGVADTPFVAGDHGINLVGTGGAVVYNMLVENVEIEHFKGAGLSGYYRNSTIKNNHIHGMADAGMYNSYENRRNLIMGNEIHDVDYSGIDCNGSENRIVENHVYDCGGGTVDKTSWAGILVWYVAGGSYEANLNIVVNNNCHDNKGHGILVGGANAVAAPYPPYGNIIEGNTCYGHSLQGGATVIPSGIAILGAESTIVKGNFCYNNYHNFIFAGYAGFGKNTCLIDGNFSLEATNDGFRFSTDGGLIIPGTGQLNQVTLTNNVDRLAGRDSYRFERSSSTLNLYDVRNNKSFGATGYGYNITDIANFTNPIWIKNWADTPGIAIDNFTNLTIAGGVIKVIKKYHLLIPQGGAVDDLDTINGGHDGMELTLKGDGTFQIDVKHNTGNILLTGAVDYLLTTTTERIKLQYDGALAKWIQLTAH